MDARAPGKIRNGEEGCYPELEHATEQRLEKLNPKSRLLRKDAPVLTRRDLDKSELENLDHDLQDMASREESLVSGSDSKTAREDEPLLGDDGDLPPVRTGTVITADGKVFDKIWLVARALNTSRTRRAKAKAQEEYTAADREVKRSTRKDKRDYIDNLANQAEEAAGQGNLKDLYQVTKKLAGKFQQTDKPVKDKNGHPLTTTEEQLKRWAEHFRELLNRPIPETPPDIPPAETELPINCDKPSKAEIRKAIMTLRNGKAAGPDEIPAEAIKADTETAVNMLHSLFSKIWEKEEVPAQWKEGIVIKLPKKGDLRDCSNYRGIMLLSVPGKVLNRILLERMREAVDPMLRDQQAGFRRNRSCADQIASLRIIVEQSLEWNSPLYINFIDYEKAFDSVDREALWKLLRHYGVPGKIISLIQCTYKDMSCRIAHAGQLSESFEVKTGVRQGCLLSPFLFLLVIDWIMKTTTTGRKNGIQWTLWAQLDDLDFADDLALLSHSHSQMQDKTTCLEATSAGTGLKINRRKTELMKINTTANTPVTVGGEPIREVESFVYLGSVVDGQGGTDRDVTARIGKARAAMVMLKNIWASKVVSIRTKLRIFNSNVKSVLLYGCETWRTTKTMQQKIQTFLNTCLRRIFNIRWPEKIRNEELWERAGQEPAAKQILRRKFDVDEEVEKVDQEPEKNKSKPVKATFKADSVAHNIDTKGMTEEEKRVKAVREKDKGNEAFHSRDFEESIVYYTRSISIAPLAATYNNRALAYLRLSKWDGAVKDCNYVLKMEPQNLKALLRRGTALKGKGDMTRAGQDMRKVLEVEPNNKTALDLMKEINAEEKKKAKEVKARKEKGRRMIIEEVDGSDDEENNVEEIEVETPDAGDNRTPALNGYTEKAESREDHTPLLNGHTGQVAADEESIAANTSDASQASRASEELQASQTSEEVQASDVTETSQAAGKEENEVDVPSSNKGTSAVDAEKEEDSSNSDTTRSQETLEKLERQKLVATNILHETTGVQEEGVESAQSAADRVKAVSDEAAVSAGAGDADSLVHVSTTDVGKAADVQQREEQSSEDDSAESETDAQEAVEQPSHARPVFIQRALSSKVADLRETGNNLFRSGQYSEAIRVYSDIISKLETDRTQNSRQSEAKRDGQEEKSNASENEKAATATETPKPEKAVSKEDQFEEVKSRGNKHVQKMCGQYKDSLQDLLQLLRLEPTNTAAKREMELVKGLYKKEFDQLKQQPTMSKPATKPEKKRKRMKIEEVEDESGSEDQDSASEKPPGAGDKPQVTKTPEGRKHGRGKGKKGVISNKLDGHMLQIITRCAAHDAQTGEVERAYNILCKLRQVPRFTTVVMFLSSKEKQDIRKVLESVASLGAHSAEDVAAVRKDYGVK
nr:hypothetical protein BaRGS_007075 [Batillaria attramentaria]